MAFVLWVGHSARVDEAFNMLYCVRYDTIRCKNLLVSCRKQRCFVTFSCQLINFCEWYIGWRLSIFWDDVRQYFHVLLVSRSDRPVQWYSRCHRRSFVRLSAHEGARRGFHFYCLEVRTATHCSFTNSVVACDKSPRWPHCLNLPSFPIFSADYTFVAGYIEFVVMPFKFSQVHAGRPVSTGTGASGYSTLKTLGRSARRIFWAANRCSRLETLLYLFELYMRRSALLVFPRSV